ncbi:uncharacterized protein PHACADRAFT_263156 [Phanerochaete carnosa HHB-10118-sp]|uniref:Uncharacterized protein n=1 Tax=Phanerochaete carnosa (strain HHB-10118-sp) TaxID=650164 RepID=K5VWG0_PHACS|nr:uncharacterized protein PHACADRAFT_263156 [Phanerochaete carnosa HHB-10118-sp]EKM51155.1 hypothetical protein PHACADRAFT_263156 [Phanerochaete carnosa HHB-10118-sp]
MHKLVDLEKLLILVRICVYIVVLSRLVFKRIPFQREQRHCAYRLRACPLLSFE